MSLDYGLNTMTATTFYGESMKIFFNYHQLLVFSGLLFIDWIGTGYFKILKYRYIFVVVSKEFCISVNGILQSGKF